MPTLELAEAPASGVQIPEPLEAPSVEVVKVDLTQLPTKREVALQVAPRLPLTRQEIIEEWAHRLRTRKHLRSNGVFRSLQPDGTTHYCAMGMLYALLQEQGLGWLDTHGFMYLGPSRIGSFEGLKTFVISVNDNGGCWNYIADYVERHG